VPLWFKRRWHSRGVGRPVAAIFRINALMGRDYLVWRRVFAAGGG
jgi:hypothetical protein